MFRNVKNNVQLQQYLQELLPGSYNAFCQAEAEPKAIRVNTLKSSAKNIEGLLSRLKIEYEKIKFSPTGYKINEKNVLLSHTLSFFLGELQYQGVASQLPVMLLDVQPGNIIMDMTAAPGSKSTQIAALMQNKGELVLNDWSYERLRALSTNMQRSGAVNFYVLKTRAERLGSSFSEYFDKILLDAPCTALGTLCANPEIISWWRPDKLQRINQIQYQLLISALKALKVNGELVYSTCSVAPEENELLIHKIVNRYPVKIIEPQQELISLFSRGIKNYKNEVLHPDLQFAIRSWPHLHQMEGFFVVKLVKTSSFISNIEKSKSSFTSTLDIEHPLVNEILINISDQWGISSHYWKNYRYILTKSRIWMVSSAVKKVLAGSFISAGLLLAEKRIYGWKLVNGSVQIFGNAIKKRRVELNHSNLKELFAHGTLNNVKIENGYYALVSDDKPVASVYIEDAEMRCRLPHKFKLVL
jgi:16S rRNA (cytosine1407-C5)-methyltransferase